MPKDDSVPSLSLSRAQSRRKTVMPPPPPPDVIPKIVRRSVNDKGQFCDEVILAKPAPLPPMPVAQQTPNVETAGIDQDHIYYDDPPEDSGESPIVIDLALAQKRIRSKAGDDPLGDWIPHLSRVLDIFIGHEAITPGSICSVCNTRPATVLCKECAGMDVLCTDCAITVHQRQPLHIVHEWNGRYLQRTSLTALGLVVHLGHRGAPCDDGQPINDFTVVHTNGVHILKLMRCGCGTSERLFLQLLRFGWFPATIKQPRTAITFQSLRQFQNLSLQCKSLSAYHYYLGVMRNTDNVGLTDTKNRYHQFRLVSRLYRHLRMLKIAARGHDPAGIRATGLRDCIVRCPACPQPGMNLPADWEMAGPDAAWLYTYMVALDANFRLKRYGRQAELLDLPLGDGYSYIVPSVPYQKYIAEHGASQTEMSSCNGMKAVDLANLRNSRGYAVSGQAGCDCARHGFKLAAADLQKGEKFINIDYVFLFALLGSITRRLLISYDVMCSWDVHLFDRISQAPITMRFDLKQLEALITAIPNFHIHGHQDKCKRYSLHFKKGVGQTCAEVIEAGWSVSNAAASSTAYMTEGARADLLNDLWNDANWQKSVRMADFLAKKLEEAATEYRIQRTIHSDFEATLKPDQLVKWVAMIDKWEADPKTAPNPYEVPDSDSGLTQAQVRRELAEEEAKADEGDTGVIPHHVSPSVWLIAGLEHEETCYRLTHDVGRKTTATDQQRAAFLEKLNATRRKIMAWREAQKVYMPGLAGFLATHAAKPQSSPSADDLDSLSRLWLPSDIPSLQQEKVCLGDVANKECRLRQAHAEETVGDLRNHLRVHSHVLRWKRDNGPTSQRVQTRTGTIIANTKRKTALCVQRYRRTRVAIMALDPATQLAEVFPPLLKEDVRWVSDTYEETIGTPATVRESSRAISWIWRTRMSTTRGQSEATDTALRVQWARSYARRLRWQEQVALVKEEMRRTVAYYRWKSAWWRDQGPRRANAASSAGTDASTLTPIGTDASGSTIGTDASAPTGDHELENEHPKFMGAASLSDHRHLSESVQLGLAAYAERQADLFEGMAAQAEKTQRESFIEADFHIALPVSASELSAAGTSMSKPNAPSGAGDDEDYWEELLRDGSDDEI